MINTILGNIASIVEKNFLFSFFLPVLLFACAIASAVVISIGPDPAIASIENLSAARWAWTSALVVIGLIVTAYVLSALRESMTQFWSGDAPLTSIALWGWIKLGTAIQRSLYKQLRAASAGQSRWADVLRTYEDDVRAVWKPTGNSAGCFVRWALRIRIKMLHSKMSIALVQRRMAVIVNTYKKYDGNSLKVEYELVKRQIIDWDEQSNFAIQGYASLLDRSYGALATVKPTRLGNIIDSYNYYAYTRYKIQADLLWPRLQYVIAASYTTSVQDAQALLDFGISMCTLGLLYTVLALMAGPWLVLDPVFWAINAGVALLVSRLFYELSVKAAMQYGDRLRASFDLFRLDLLKQLGFGRPTKLSEERETWQKLSQLVVYGADIDLPIAAEKSP
jgi:hypothetical protein